MTSTTASLKAHFDLARATLADTEVAALNAVRGDAADPVAGVDDGLSAIGKLVRDLVITADSAIYQRDVARRGQAAAEARIFEMQAAAERSAVRISDLERLDGHLGRKIASTSPLKTRIAELMDLVDAGDRERDVLARRVISLHERCVRLENDRCGGGSDGACVECGVDELPEHLRDFRCWRHTPLPLVDEPACDEGDTDTKPLDGAAILAHLSAEPEGWLLYDANAGREPHFAGPDLGRADVTQLYWEDDLDKLAHWTSKAEAEAALPVARQDIGLDHDDDALRVVTVAEARAMIASAAVVDVSHIGAPTPVLPTAPKLWCEGCGAKAGRGHFAGCEGGAA